MATKRTVRKKRSVLPLLIGGILLFGGAAYYYISSQEDPAVVKKRPAPVRPVGKVAMPVLARSLPRGAELSMRSMRIDYVEPEDVPEDAVIVPKVFEGRWLVNALSRGDYIREADLAAPGAPKSFSGYIPQGERVVILPASSLPGSMGYVQSGDLIDIYSNGAARIVARQTFDPAQDGTQPGQRPSNTRSRASGSSLPRATIRLVSRAEVLQAPRPTRDNSQDDIVLVMSDDEALQLQLARANNERFGFVFRAADDTTEGPMMIQRDRDPRSVEIIKGLKKSTVMTRLDWRENEVINY